MLKAQTGVLSNFRGTIKLAVIATLQEEAAMCAAIAASSAAASSASSTGN